jgi:hypothetical protein
MQTVEDKIDAAVHAAFMAMGLSVERNISLACELADWLHENTKNILTYDEEDI